MKFAFASLTLAGLLVGLLAAPSVAHAQTGTCSGNSFSGVVGLAVQPAGNMGKVDYTAYESVAAASVSYVFDNAECLCHTDDIALDIYLGGGQALPQGSTGSVELWLGTGCDNDTTRTTATQTVCQKVPLSDVSITNFSLYGSTVNGHIYIPIPAQALMAPVTGICPTSAAGNSIYLFIFTGSNISPSGDPYATCELDLTEQAAGPVAGTSFTGVTGDGAANLSWGTPAGTTAQYYQILCANADGTPVAGKGNTQYYSTCLPPGGPADISRRAVNTGGTLGSLTDGGTIALTDAGTIAAATATPKTRLGITPFDSTDGGIDGGTDGGSVDMLTTNATPLLSGLPSPFANFDPKYLCSDRLQVAGTTGSSQSTRITGLTNGLSYQFALVALDQYGNPTATDSVLTVTPQPVEDLYRRFRDDGTNDAHGFCFIATATYGSYEHRYVRVLRAFRDRVLLPTRAGAAFVAWYYGHSPPAANYIAQHAVARALARVLLLPIIGLAALWLFSPHGCQLFALLLVGLWLRRRLLRRYQHPQSPSPVTPTEVVS